MVATTIEQQILEQIRHLNDDQKRDALNYLRSLTEIQTPRGTPAAEFVASALAANFDHQDLQEIMQAIEEEK